MNKAELIGRLTRDPDIRYSQSAQPVAIARYTLAVDRRRRKSEGGQSTDFISCIAFGNNAEFANRYLRKGMKIAIVGRIQTGSYTDKDGRKVYTTDVLVEEHDFCESKGAAAGAARSSAGSTGWTDSDGFMDIPDDIEEDLPFV